MIRVTNEFQGNPAYDCAGSDCFFANGDAIVIIKYILFYLIIFCFFQTTYYVPFAESNNLTDDMLALWGFGLVYFVCGYIGLAYMRPH